MYKRKDAPGSSNKKPYKKYKPYNKAFKPSFKGPSGRAEKKVSDVGTATYQVNTTGTFTLLHAPIPGTDYTQRIGRKTNAKSVYIRGRVQSEAASSAVTSVNGPAQLTRMIVFIDSQPNIATPVVTDLLVSADPASQLNLNNRDRFKIVRDETFFIDPYIVDASVTAATVKFNRTGHNLECYNKLNLETIFNAGSAGTIADITTGALYMFWIGSNPAGTGSDANAIVSARVRYLDA